MSERYREIKEYIERFAEKEHITPEEALDYVMAKLFEQHKKENPNESIVD